jgi:hypothetical protein
MAETSDPKTGEPPIYADVLNDPEWVEGVSKLLWAKSPYGGFFLRGTCPICNHHEGINVFVPTTWTTVGGLKVGAVPTVQAPEFNVESVPQSLCTSSETAKESFEPEVLTKATDKSSKTSNPTEVVRCSCNESHIGTPSGKSGCGRWGFISVPMVPASHV